MVAKVKYPKLAITRGAPDEVRAVINKLIHDPTLPTSSANVERRISLSRDVFERISKDTGQDAIDANSVFQLLPDVELANQILVGSIISPKDMSTVELDFTVAEHQFDSELSRTLLAVIENHFKVDYKIDDRLDAILEEILFTRGAHILAVLPENNLDHIINSGRRLSMESFNQVIGRIHAGKPMGFLGHPTEANVSMESFRDRSNATSRVQGLGGGDKPKLIQVPYLTVTDNYECLKLSNFSKIRRNLHVNQLLRRHHVSLESASKGLSPQEIDSLYSRQRPAAETTQVVVPQTYIETAPVGHPLVMKLPIESVIPVYVPGEPGEHVGYFVMIDENGRPVQREEGKDYYGELRTSFRANTQTHASEMVRQVKEAMGGVQHRTDLEYEQIQQTYAAIIENDLINRLRNGIYKEEFSVNATEEIYRIMLYRSLKAKQTQLLYIPAELVTYMAFNFNQHGVGQTLLTQSKILSSMRSVLLFAETMSGVRNAIGRKRASISIDAEDPDPQKTISDVQSAILESAHRGFPLGSPDPAQTLDYLNRAGFDFSINVDSDNYPTTKVEFDDYNTQVNAGNPELQDRLRRMHIAGMGLSPEWVDPQQAPEFAVSVVNNNLIMTRRVIRYQKQFTEFLSKFVRTYTQHSSTLRSQLLTAMQGNKGKLAPHLKSMDEESVIDEFINSICAGLPAPDTTKIDLQLQAFDQYSQALDRALEAYITNDLFPPEVLAAEPDTVTLVITVVKSYYQRMWLERNNVMPELDQLTRIDGKSPAFSLLDIQSTHQETLGQAIHEYVKALHKRKEKWEKKYGTTEEPEGDTDGFGDDTLDTDVPTDDSDDLGLDTDDASDDLFDDPGDTEAEEVVEDEEPEEPEDDETADEEAIEDEGGDES